MNGGCIIQRITLAVLVMGGLCTNLYAERLLIIHPGSWGDGVSNFAAFKSSLGLEVAQVTTESIAGTGTLTHAALRTYLLNYSSTYSTEVMNVMFVGDFNAIPAPAFKVVPTGRPYPDASSYSSDVYYRDLHTDFNRDGDGLYGEYDTSGATQDFDNATFATTLSAMTNDIRVGRIPIDATASVTRVRTILDGLVAFERDTGAYKRNALLTAGRINTSALLPADSWDYVVRDLTTDLRSSFTNHGFTTVVHAAPGYTNLTGIDYRVEGTNTTTDYLAGQAVVRALLNSNDNVSFICTVSHGSTQNDFALTRTGLGLPGNSNPFIGMSMSCSSYQVGRAAITTGVAVAWLGSVAVVEPDVSTLYTGTNMVSGDVQRYACRWIACENVSIGKAFADALTLYVSEIPLRAATFMASYKPELLRNVVGFHLEGDPSMVHARPDTDGDSLLDDQERVIGTDTNRVDTDFDGFPDAYEVAGSGLDPLVNAGMDVDGDQCLNADELLAGTDPQNSADFPSLSQATLDHLNAEITFSVATVTGRFYSIKASTSLTSPMWTNVISDQLGTGGIQHFSAPMLTSDPSAFYRLHILVP